MRSCIKGVTPEWWTLPGDEDEAEPVQFKIMPLNGIDQAMVIMGAYNQATGEVETDGIIKAFRYGVTGWRNIEDCDNPGEQLKFSKQAMQRIPPTWIMQAGARVMEVSSLSEDDSKN